MEPDNVKRLGVDAQQWKMRSELRNGDLMNCDMKMLDLAGVDLANTNLREGDLRMANLSWADLRGTDLYGSDLRGANFSNANLCGAKLGGAHMTGTNLSHANLRGTDFSFARMFDANLTGADLTGADLTHAKLDNADLTDSDLTGCRVFGTSAWRLTLKGACQDDLIISDPNEPVVTVDDLELAQFTYLMLGNETVRQFINTMTSKVVLILGRFGDPLRKAVLDGLRQKLRKLDLLPIVFDFDRPTDKDYTETIQMLAGMSMFIIADITNPKSTPLELEATVKHFKIPYLPIIDVSVDQRPFAMLVDLQKSFHWVLPTLGYNTGAELLDDAVLQRHIIAPAMAKREELRKAKSDEPGIVFIDSPIR